MHRFILNFTPNGMVPTRQMTPHVPLTPDEIVAQTLEAAALGANMIHLHARDADGHPTYEKEIYARIIGGIREKNPELVLCVSTSGRTHKEFWQRSQVLELTGDLKPDFGSLTTSSLNFAKEPSLNAPDMIRDLARKMADNGIRPEIECFDLGMINGANYLIERGVIRPPYYFNIIVGNLYGAQADPLSLGAVLHGIPPHSYWSAGGIGAAQLTANTMALANGGGIRIGLEDNIWFDAGRTRLASNRDLVERISGIARLLGLEPYTAREARALVCPVD